jgi:diguanylate cyclase (GGDEF)-like protein
VLAETLSSSKRTIHVTAVLLANKPEVLEQLRNMAHLQGWDFAWASGIPSLTQSFATDHPDLVILVGGVLGDQELALIRFMRAREKSRRVGIMTLCDTSKIPAGRRAQTLESGADDVLEIKVPQEELLARIRGVMRQKFLVDELRRSNHFLKLQSLTDELTGLANMRHFNQQISEEMTMTRSGLQALALVMIDIDYFKNINDTANHLVGSALLAQLGNLLGDYVQKNQGELAARFGGDEFVLLLKANSYEESLNRCEALREKIKNRIFNINGIEFRITASFGVAWVPAGYGGSAQECIKAADLKLYRSKKRGRNMVSGISLEVDQGFQEGTKMQPRLKSLGKLLSLEHLGKTR